MYKKSVFILLAIAYAATIVKNGDAVCVFIGRVEHKCFYADRNHRNWTQAKTFCISMNMNLASIDSDEELAFLQKGYKSSVFARYHWLTEMVSMTVTPVWNVTVAAVNDTMPKTKVEIPYLKKNTCAVYEASASVNNSGLRMLECSDSHGFSLCETNHQK